LFASEIEGAERTTNSNKLPRDFKPSLLDRKLIDQHDGGLALPFAGTAVTMDHLNSRLLLGQQINLAEQAQAVSALVRVASRLGLSRRAKDVGPTLGDILVAGDRWALQRRQAV
jgi:hypothetical protein